MLLAPNCSFANSTAYLYVHFVSHGTRTVVFFDSVFDPSTHPLLLLLLLNYVTKWMLNKNVQHLCCLFSKFTSPQRHTLCLSSV